MALVPANEELNAAIVVIPQRGEALNIIRAKMLLLGCSINGGYGNWDVVTPWGATLMEYWPKSHRVVVHNYELRLLRATLKDLGV